MAFNSDAERAAQREYKAKRGMEISQSKVKKLESQLAAANKEIERLRELVEEAYREGWEDAIRDVDTFNHAWGVLEKSWNESETRVTLEGDSK